MKLLHTSDWHVGKALPGGGSRLDEFRAVLDQVIEIAVDEAVDAVMVAGDVYENRMPSPEADEVVFETLAHLHEARIPLVAICGNHDSEVRLRALARVLRALDVHVAHTVLGPDDGGIVKIPSRTGDGVAEIACIPFVPERRVGDAMRLFSGEEQWTQAYAGAVGDILRRYGEAFSPDAVRVVMAHLFVANAKLGGGEREVTCGPQYAVPASSLPAQAHYIALGHIHRPQNVPGSGAPARYSGSLLQLDFGEVDQDKSVTIVEATPTTTAKVRQVGLTAGRRLLDVRGSLDELAAQAGALGDAHLRVSVRCDGPTPGIGDRVREILPNTVAVKLDYERTDREEITVSSLQPREQFVAYFRQAHGAEPADPLLLAFDEVFAEVAGETL